MTPSSDADPNARDRHKAGASKTSPRTSRNQIAVARGAGMVVIRVIGMGNMATAPALDEFLDAERQEGFRRFLFDMSQCRGLDSTFMGCMIGLYTALHKDDPSHPPPGPGLPDEAVTTAHTKPKGKQDGPPPPDGYESDGKLEPLSREEALSILERSFGLSSSSPQSDEQKGEMFVIAVNVSVECREVMGILGVDKFVRIGGEVDLSGLEAAVLPDKQMAADERRRLILRAHENLVEIDKRNEAQFGAFLKSLSDELSK